MITLAVRCSKCGHFTAKSTSDIQKCIFKCGICGKSGKLRTAKHGWNFTVHNITGKNIPECIKEINKYYENR